jgi:mono/diheme cytochrome c family protein
MVPHEHPDLRTGSILKTLAFTLALFLTVSFLPPHGIAGDSPGIDRLLGGQGRSDLKQQLGELTFEGGKTFTWEDFSGWGQELYFTGTVKTPPIGPAPSKPLSKVFTCVVCHANQREDPDLALSDPEARLTWIEKTGAKISMLQGATLWGIVNRTSFYADDFTKYHNLCVPKGDDLPWMPCGPILGWCNFGCRTMEPTSLIDATQVCSSYCSVGRYLEQWELYSFLAYYWDREITLADLDLPPDRATRVKEVLTSPAPDPGEAQEMRDLLAAKYLRNAPFTYRGKPTVRTDGPGGAPIATYEDGFMFTGDAAQGQRVWKRSCAHCHDRKERPFNAEKAKHLTEDLDKFHGMLADGTRSSRKAYMPNFALERLSRQQSADILAYLLAYPQ